MFLSGYLEPLGPGFAPPVRILSRFDQKAQTVSATAISVAPLF